MTTLSVSPSFPIFTDRDGSPLENGYIWIGTAALNPITNPISVYWDAALTQLAAQPIRTLNGYPSNAGTPARLHVGSDYSILLQDQKGTLVYSSLNETAPNADNVVFIQAGAGAQPRSVQAKLREWVSPEDFGAVGDGNAIDTDALQDAIDTGKNIRGTPGANYRIGPLTQATAGQFLDFSGCTLTLINSSAHAAMLTLNAARTKVLGGYWDGNKANQSGTVVDQYAHAAVTVAADYCVVDSIESVNSFGMGVKGLECSYMSVRNCRITAPELFGVYAQGTVADEYGNEILDNSIFSSAIDGASGIYLTGSNDFVYNQYRWKIARNLCVGPTSGTPTGIGITTRAIYGIISENTTVGYTMGISADSATRTVISNNNISDTAGASDYGIELNSGYNAVTGNVIRNAKYGIILSGLMFVQDHNQISSNLIENSSRSIFVQAATNAANYLNIVSNTFIHTGAATGQVGVYLGGDCKYSNVSGNLMKGPGIGVGNGYGVFLDGAGSFVNVSGNRMSDWDYGLGLFSAAAHTFTDITLSGNDCTKDMPAPISLINVGGSATAGARIIQMWNNTSNGIDYNVLDKATSRLMMWSSAFATPESNVTAAIGSLYFDLNGGAGTTMYVKETGAGNTGWVGK